MELSQQPEAIIQEQSPEIETLAKVEENPTVQYIEQEAAFDVETQQKLLQERIIHQRFQKVFGSQFQGHAQHLQKKLLKMRQSFIDDQKSGKRHHGVDFQDIHHYRHLVNQKIFDLIRQGLFQKIKDLD